MKKEKKLKPELSPGFRDWDGIELQVKENIISEIKKTFRLFGFEPLETSSLEISENIGKFLPDEDRPMSGVFGFKDENQWLSLRYDLTAPLARYVARNFRELPNPFKRFQLGQVWRNEKPDPGRFKEFTQLDADIVGSDSILADAEMCILLAEILYPYFASPKIKWSIKVSNRKLIIGLLEDLKIKDDAIISTVTRAIDKLDRLNILGVKDLLKKGRKDSSGDFTKGANLSDEQVDIIAGPKGFLSSENINQIKDFSKNTVFQEGVDELNKIFEITNKSKYSNYIIFSPSVVRGLDYYTGTIFEANIDEKILNSKGQRIRFGSVGGGGRYDNLIERFTNTKYPATGLSIGIDRLNSVRSTAASVIGKYNTKGGQFLKPIIICVLDKKFMNNYLEILNILRENDIASEIYLGKKDLKSQLVYANKRRSPAVIIVGENEIKNKEIKVKDFEKKEEIITNKKELLNEIKKLFTKNT